MGVRRNARAAVAAVAVCLAVALAVEASATAGEPAASSAAPDDRFLIGVVPQRSLDPGEARLIGDAGIESVRFWLPWHLVESDRDRYDWSYPDAIVSELAAENLTPFPYLFGSPAWVGKRDGHECAGADCIPYPPATIETRYAFARFTAAAARRYGPDGAFWEAHPGLPSRPIRAWQVWNEPNLESFYRPDVNATDYAGLVELVSTHIRASDPDGEIVLGGLTGTRTNTRRQSTSAFLRELYRVPGVGASFDGIAIHPYAPGVKRVFAQIRGARAVAASRDGNVDLWITEVGWASAGKRSWNLVTDLEGQARLLGRVFGRLLQRAEGWRIRAAYWYAWRDSVPGQAVCGWCPASGLIDRDGFEKPAYRALRRLTEQR